MIFDARVELHHGARRARARRRGGSAASAPSLRRGHDRDRGAVARAGARDRAARRRPRSRARRARGPAPIAAAASAPLAPSAQLERVAVGECHVRRHRRPILVGGGAAARSPTAGRPPRRRGGTLRRVESLRGKLLIAAPMLVDPNFARTVVLIAAHDENGALGLILNRPLDVPLAEISPALDALAEPGSTLHRGGPVAPESAVVLADFSDPSLAALTVFGTVGFPSADCDLDDARGRRAARARVRRALGLGSRAARRGARGRRLDHRPARTRRAVAGRHDGAVVDGARAQGRQLRAARADARGPVGELVGGAGGRQSASSPSGVARRAALARRARSARPRRPAGRPRRGCRPASPRPPGCRGPRGSARAARAGRRGGSMARSARCRGSRSRRRRPRAAGSRRPRGGRSPVSKTTEGAVKRTSPSLTAALPWKSVGPPAALRASALSRVVGLADRVRLERGDDRGGVDAGDTDSSAGLDGARPRRAAAASLNHANASARCAANSRPGCARRVATTPRQARPVATQARTRRGRERHPVAVAEAPRARAPGARACSRSRPGPSCPRAGRSSRGASRSGRGSASAASSATEWRSRPTGRPNRCRASRGSPSLHCTGCCIPPRPTRGPPVRLGGRRRARSGCWGWPVHVYKRCTVDLVLRYVPRGPPRP